MKKKRTIGIFIFCAVLLAGCASEVAGESGQSVDSANSDITQPHSIEKESGQGQHAASTDDGENQEIRIETDQSFWRIDDVPLEGFPEDGYVVGVTKDAVYYYRQVEKETEEVPSEIAPRYCEYHYLTADGKDTLLLTEDPAFSYADFCMYHDKLIVASWGTGGTEVFFLSPEQGKEAFFAQDGVLPTIQVAGQRIASLRRENNSDQGKYEQDLVLTDLESGEDRVVYAANYTDSTGERIAGISLTDEGVFFVTTDKKEGKEEHFFYRYDIAEGKITQKISVPRAGFYAAGIEDMIFISESDNEKYLEEAGALGKVVDGTFVETGRLPFVTGSEVIRYGAYTEKGLLMSGPLYGYFWDRDLRTIYICDGMNMPLSERISRLLFGEDGFLCVMHKNGKYLIRHIIFEPPAGK